MCRRQLAGASNYNLLAAKWPAIAGLDTFILYPHRTLANAIY